MSSAVSIRRDSVVLPTYEPHPPDLNPMFLEKRVYQGSSGKVYPLPFTDRIAEKSVPRAWDAIHLENEFLYVMILPQLGGRIHIARDKTNGYDFIYNQPVIKPALVGLAGPWASGGIEFNWPQHHRPSTFMPADVAIDHAADGSVTVWLSEHDPMARMKGMHGVCLAPGRAVLEVKVRVYNRTPLAQTFLWWANVATRVHEHYQSFFPPDVTYVADHAKRAMSTFPLATGHYYGVDYAARAKHGVPAGERPVQFVPPHGAKREEGALSSQLSALSYPPNDLSWYANIPVPTSYMCMGTDEDFFGGYDHAARAGLVHVADHHIAPGKKQWTWGNHPFGYAWDRNLTDADAHGEYAPYIELMAGVFTDNQPDFSFLAPGETKTWSQHWYPIREIGVAHRANLAAAVSLRVASGRARLGVSVTSPQPGATVRLSRRGRIVSSATIDLSPSAPHVAELPLPRAAGEIELTLTVLAADGRELITYTPKSRPNSPVPPAATEPPAPRDISSADELYVTGLHLEQYRHATRRPTDYWREALRRDPGDVHCNDALGLWHFRRGEFAGAEKYFRAAIARLTQRNPNPSDGAPHYHLGLCLRHLGRDDEAYTAFYKSTWNAAQQPAAFHALAELDCRRADWSRALEHLDAALRLNTDNLRARNLKVIVLRRLGRAAEADALLAATLALDPLDWWARSLVGPPLAGVPPPENQEDPARRQAPSLQCDTQTRLDLAHDHARAGLHAEAIALLSAATPEPTSGTAPLVAYTLAWLSNLIGYRTEMHRWLAIAAEAAPDYCFPARLEEIAVLQFAIAANPRDARAPYYLGNLLYDRRRHQEAIALWEKSARLDPSFSIAWRNLGIGYFNVANKPARARAAYERALSANPRDARVLYERDQLWKRLGESPARRLRELESRRDLVAQRDDLTIEFCALLNTAGRHTDAVALLSARKFQPWEGGEGLALGQHVRTHLALGRAALRSAGLALVGRPQLRPGDKRRPYAEEELRALEAARTHFEAALAAPENLSEAKHLLANQSDIHFWLGCALEAAGDRPRPREHWTIAATFRGDFQEMSVRAFSELTYYSALALEKIGRRAEAKKLLRGLLAHARQLARTPAKIDYFATSLPTMLLFDDDLDRRQKISALFLEAQARLGLGERAAARRLLARVLRLDPGHAPAADLVADCRP